MYEALCIWETSGSVTGILAIGSNVGLGTQAGSGVTNGVSGALLVIGTGNSSTASFCHGIERGSVETCAFEGTCNVLAFGLAAADSLVSGALVDVVTVDFRVSSVSRLASAREAARFVRANGIATAFTRRSQSLVAFIDIWKEF